MCVFVCFVLILSWTTRNDKSFAWLSCLCMYCARAKRAHNATIIFGGCCTVYSSRGVLMFSVNLYSPMQWKWNSHIFRLIGWNRVPIKSTESRYAIDWIFASLRQAMMLPIRRQERKHAMMWEEDFPIHCLLFHFQWVKECSCFSYPKISRNPVKVLLLSVIVPVRLPYAVYYLVCLWTQSSGCLPCPKF